KDTSPDVFRVVAYDYDDRDAPGIAQKLADSSISVNELRQGPAFAWNTALKFVPNFDAYILAADDLIFFPYWLEETLVKLDEIGGSGLIGFNDKKVVSDDLFSSHYLMTRDFMIAHHGGVMAIPHYNGNGVDVEACERAQQVKLYARADDAFVHHDWKGNKADSDSTYKIGATRRKSASRLIRQRRRKNWPDDFQPILMEVKNANRTFSSQS
ncbi:unnamed protein product, partial [marine sediment metagenome]